MMLGLVERGAFAHVLSKIWGWWIMPFFPKAPELTFISALGIGFIWSILTLNESMLQGRILMLIKEDDDWDSVYWSVVTILLVWPMTLGMAYIFKLILL